MDNWMQHAAYDPTFLRLQARELPHSLATAALGTNFPSSLHGSCGNSQKVGKAAVPSLPVTPNNCENAKKPGLLRLTLRCG